MTTIQRTSLFILIAALFALGSSAAERRVRPDWTDIGTLWQSGDYVYDAAGNITAIGSDTYHYDSLLRLQTATAKTPGHDTNAQAFTYDRYGNMLTVTTAGAPSAAMAANPVTNRLDGTCAQADTCIRAQYDVAGNQTGLEGTLNTYVWDDLGMMNERTVTGGAAPRTRYVYDANNERIALVSVDSNGATLSTRYTLRGADTKVSRELVETPAGGLQWSKDYVYRGSTLLAAYTTDTPGPGPHRHFHLDHLGTPRLITDAAGYKLAHHTYWPFGREAAGSELDAERMKFTGHERDSAGPGAEALDLDYMHARFYDPTASRFLSVDPAANGIPREPQTWNRYSYAHNNPLTKIDPNGQDALSVVFPKYQITFKGRRVPGLGHAGIVTIDKNGGTRYYEYGRYDPAGKGLVQRRAVPDVVMGSNGYPTTDSLQNLMSSLSKIGKDGPVEGAYFKNADASKVNAYAESRKAENTDSNREPYSLLTNSCSSFMTAAVEAGGVDLPWYANGPRPNDVIEDHQREAQMEIDYTPGKPVEVDCNAPDCKDPES